MRADDFWLDRLTFADGRRVALLVRGGVIGEIAERLPDGTAAFDLDGWLCVPPLVEGHCHLDKTFLGAPWQSYRGPPGVPNRIATEKEVRLRLDVPAAVRAAALLEREIAFGTGYLRTHVDVSPEWGLDNLEAVLGIREAFAGRIAIEIVAFPQSGIAAAPGTADLLDAALGAGADLVGGLDPWAIDGARNDHLDVVFALAEKHGKGVDIHLHEGGAEGLTSITAIAERTAQADLGGRVTISHAFALADLDAGGLARTADLLAEAGVAILSSAPPVHMPPLKALHAHGVTVGLGSDNIRDAWSPFGNGDMLDRAHIAARQQGWVHDADLTLGLDLVTHGNARLLGLSGYGIEPGGPADFVLLRAPSAALAVAEPPHERIVVKGGKVIAGPTLETIGGRP